MIKSVGVIGSGTMGSGIAQVAASTGHQVTLIDTTIERANSGRDRVASHLQRSVDKEKISAEDRERALDNIKCSATFEDIASVDVVIEAVFEDLATKTDVIRQVGAVTSETTLFATNTSSISITRLAAAHPRPATVAGMHFFNPVPVLPLAELIRAEQSGDETISALAALAESFGKTAVHVMDSPGFVVNRILIPMISEAVLCLESGVATREAIDQTMKLGAAHPMGPLELADLIGLDVVLSIMDVLQRDFGDDKYRPPVSLRRMVAAGKLGRKSGEGFYVHS